MVKKVGNYKIPYDMEGNQLDYINERWSKVDQDFVWRDNVPFEDIISYHGFERGQSAARFIFRRSTGEKLTVFMVDLGDMMPYIVGGKVSGKFVHVKRGQNYGTTRLN